MSRRKKNFPYLELGSLLQSWRKERFDTAKDLWIDAKLNFSYSRYADFERGVSLPSIENLIEIAKYHGKEMFDVALIWAEVQMPEQELRDLFQSRRKPREKKQDIDIDSEPKSAAPSFQNTWVFSPAEIKHVTENLWLLDVCNALITGFPNKIALKELLIPKEIKIDLLEKEYLKPWIQSGHMILSEKGLSLRVPHIYIPKTPEWEEGRKNNIRRVNEHLLSNVTQEMMDLEEAYRFLMHRPLTKNQIKKWVKRVKEFESDFSNDLLVNSKEDSSVKSYALYLALGPR